MRKIGLYSCFIFLLLLLQNCDKTNPDSAYFDVQFAVPETVSIKEGAASMATCSC